MRQIDPIQLISKSRLLDDNDVSIVFSVTDMMCMYETAALLHDSRCLYLMLHSIIQTQWKTAEEPC